MAIIAFIAVTYVRAEELFDLTELSLEDLLNMEVTSVSRKAESFFNAPAAIYVLTAEDIKRSGATSIPDALRLVPGLHVAKITSHVWSVSSRGFSGRYANKLLVLVDGRSVYNITYSGVYWETLDLMLDDIERIEVIRGPGGTLWGANAVNGVINIITKKAKDSQGGYITSTYGTLQRPEVGVRYGGKIKDNGFYRLYGKYYKYPSFEDTEGRDAEDEIEIDRVGFRLDWNVDDASSWLVEGDFYQGTSGELAINDVLGKVNLTKDCFDLRGADLLLRYSKMLKNDAELNIQFYYDRVERTVTFPTVKTWEEMLTNPDPQSTEESFYLRTDTYDLDIQHRFTPVDCQEIVWGGGIRVLKDRYVGETYIKMTPESKTSILYNAFIQDEFKVIPDTLSFILGSKFEHNDFTGFEYQPGARLIFTPAKEHILWASVARAVRTPTRMESDVFSKDQEILTQDRTQMFNPATGIETVDVSGNDDLESEKLIAYEIGYRGRYKDLFWDLTCFYDDYDKLIGYTAEEKQLDQIIPMLIGNATIYNLPYTHANNMKGQVYGLELALHYDVADWWRLKANYSYLHINIQQEGEIPDDGSELSQRADYWEGSSPAHQVKLWSSWDLPENFTFDLMGYYIDELSFLGIDRYFNLDARLGWTPEKNIEISLCGQNLLTPSHQEYLGEFQHTTPVEIPRLIYIKLDIHF